MADICTPCQFGGCAHCRPPCDCDHGGEGVVLDSSLTSPPPSLAGSDRIAELEATVDYLLSVVAYEARVIEAQTLDLASLAKGRRKVLAESVESMREVATHGQSVRYGYPARRELDLLRRESA